MAFNLSKENSKNLRKAITKFNAKIRRLESSDRDLDIPEKESISAIKERVNTKWDLNREINRLERFTKRNAEEMITTKAGVKMSRWELENLQREQRRLLSRLSREIERYGDIRPTIFGEKQVATYSQMGDERITNLKARRNALSGSISKMNKQDIKDLEAIINKTAAIFRRDKSTFYDSYLDGTLLNLGYQTGYPEWKLLFIREKLKKLNENQFIKAFNTEAGLKALQDKYMISKEQGVRIDDISEDVNNILDVVFNNIDKILETYK